MAAYVCRDTEKRRKRRKRKSATGRHVRIQIRHPSSHLIRYVQLHEQGKTDQAKADLARLAKIRAEREAAQAKRKAETEGTLHVSSSYNGDSPTNLAKAAEVEAKRKEEMAKKQSKRK